MLRKLSLVAIAAASLGVAALAPTSASAWGGWHMAAGTHGWGWGAPASSSADPPITRRLWRLLCAASGWDPLGAPLAAGEPLLLMLGHSPSPDFMPRPSRRGLSFRPGTNASSLATSAQRLTETNSGFPDLVSQQLHRDVARGTRPSEPVKRTVMDSRINQRFRMSSITGHAGRSAMPSANGCSRTCVRNRRSPPICSNWWISCASRRPAPAEERTAASRMSSRRPFGA